MSELKTVEVAKSNSGTDIRAGIVAEDHLSALQGVQASEIYNKMRRSDPQVRKILAAIMGPIKSSIMTIEPVSDDEADLEAASLIRQILFRDISFTKFLHEALTYIVHGHSVFEVVHKNIPDSEEFGPYTSLAQLGFRNQDTLTEWRHDQKTGALIRIRQQQYGDIITNEWLDAENLLVFYHEQEGDNNGFPLLRPLYGPWKRKLLAQELMFIGIERFAIPTPKLKVPKNVSSESQEYEDAVNVLRKYTGAEDAFVTYPEGWELDLVSNAFDPTKVKQVIKGEDEQMVGAILATFLELGIGGNSGAFALGDNLAEFFLNGVEYFAHIVSDTINRELIPALMKLNKPEITIYPELKFTGIKDIKGKELADLIAMFVDKQVIQSDETLEDHVRKTFGLPKKAEGDSLDNQESSEGTEDGSNRQSEDENLPPVDEDSNEEKIQSLKLEDESLKLSIRGIKDPSELIERDEVVIKESIKRNLTFTRDKLIADIIKKYNQLPDASKKKATNKLKVGGQAKFRKELKTLLTSLSLDALDLAKKSVPGKSNVKLSDDSRILSVLDPEGTFKFNDFSKLPRREQILIDIQAGLVSERLTRDLSERVEFQFQSSESSTRDPEILKQDMMETSDKFIDGVNPAVAAANVSAMVVNETTNDFLFEPEVLDEIESFTFMNDDPKTDICKSLAGRTFSTNDAEFMRYQPPLHHNCKSYIAANLKGSKNNPSVEGLPTITKSARESITLSQVINKGALNARD